MLIMIIKNCIFTELLIYWTQKIEIIGTHYLYIILSNNIVVDLTMSKSNVLASASGEKRMGNIFFHLSEILKKKSLYFLSNPHGFGGSCFLLLSWFSYNSYITVHTDYGQTGVVYYTA